MDMKCHSSQLKYTKIKKTNNMTQYEVTIKLIFESALTPIDVKL